MTEIYMMKASEWMDSERTTPITLYRIALDAILEAERQGYILATPIYDEDENENN